MTQEQPEFSDDESRLIQAEIDRIRAGLEWLRLGRAVGGTSAEGDCDASGLDDFRALTERMQFIADRSRAHAGYFERMMALEPEAGSATFAEVQQMLAATLESRKRSGAKARDPAVKGRPRHRRSA